ncbi:hypothetical protein D3C87_1314750 [compost metagenome]
MNLCRLLDQIQTEACSWRVRIDAVKRLEYLLALRDGDARAFIANVNEARNTDPDRDSTLAAAMIDCVANEIDDRHLDDRSLDREHGLSFTWLEIELVTGIHRNRREIGRDALDKDVQVLPLGG